jgi:P27 family predicted phage terminase small subunit
MAANLVPISLRSPNSHYKPEQVAEREEAERYYQLSRLRLVPPAELNERAARHFEEIANVAFWLDELSTDALGAYCAAWDRYLTLLNELNNETDVVNSEKGQRDNPKRKAMLDYVATMTKLSASLGLANIDRLKLAVTKKERTVNKFAEFVET